MIDILFTYRTNADMDDRTHHLSLQHLLLGLARISSGLGRITLLDTSVYIPSLIPSFIAALTLRSSPE